MTQYIALLRGINVGGKNKISMPELNAAFEKSGFLDVATYINSGNIIFSTDRERGELAGMCEKVIEDAFRFAIRVTVVSAKELTDWLSHAPSWWDNNADSKHNAIFVIPPATTGEVMTAIGAMKPEYESIDFCGQLIFWSAPIATFSRTRLTKIVHTSASDNITVRNANTAKKLATLLSE